MITRRGKDVAMLVPASRRSRRSPREVIEHIRQTREVARLPKGYTLRRLIEEGRRF
jgi:antitoxin (DNA-binding transcriptional repressor) of toxin-antitoxin stability system